MQKTSKYLNIRFIIIIFIILIGSFFVFCYKSHLSKGPEQDNDIISPNNVIAQVGDLEIEDISSELTFPIQTLQEEEIIEENLFFEDLVSSLHYPGLKEDLVPLDLTPGKNDPRAQEIALKLWHNFKDVNEMTFYFQNIYADPDRTKNNSTGVIYFQKPFYLRKEGRGDTIAYRYVTDGKFQRKVIRTKGRPNYPEYEKEQPDDTDLENFLSDGMQVNIASLAFFICSPSSFTSLGEEKWQDKECLKIKSNGMVFWVDKESNQIEKVQMLMRGGIVIQEWRNFEYEKIPYKTIENDQEKINEFLFPVKFDIVSTSESNQEIVMHRTIHNIEVNAGIPSSTFDLKLESFKIDDLWEKEYEIPDRMNETQGD